MKKIFKKAFRYSAILFFSLLCLPFLLYIPLFYNPNFYKDQIIERVDQFTDYKLELEKFSLSVYPSLRIELQNIDLKVKANSIPILKLEKIHVSIFFLGYLFGGKLSLDDLTLFNGFTDIPALLNSIPPSKEKPKIESPEEPIPKSLIDFLHTQVRVKQIRIENVEIRIKEFHPAINHNPKVKEATIRYESFLDSEIFLDTEYGTTNLILKGNAGISPNELSLSSLFYKVNLSISKIPIQEYSKYLKSVSGLNFFQSNLKLELDSNKNPNTLTIQNNLDCEINSIGYKDKENIQKRIGAIRLQGNIDYPLLSSQIQTTDLQLTIPGLIHLNLNSNLNFSYHPILRMNVNSKYVHIDSILNLIESFSQANSPSPTPENAVEKKTEKNIQVDLRYHLNLVTFQKFQFYNLFLITKLHNSALHLHAGIPNLADGKLNIKGEVNLKNGVAANADIEIENVNSEKLTKELLGKKMAEGTLFSYLKLQTDDKYGEKDFLKNLSLSGTTILKDGVLLDRADILYPVRFLNKIIPSQDKLNTNISRFDSIEIDYTIKNQRFKMKNLTMKGKVFNTQGTADIGLENPSEDIHANLIVSTRIGGTGIKIPLTYSRSSYVPFSIDKVWMASVYTGMVMGGPIGAVIGSALSERADAAFKTIKNKSEDAIKENTGKLFYK